MTCGCLRGEICICQARIFPDFQIGTFCTRERCKSLPKSIALDKEFQSLFGVELSHPALLICRFECHIWCQGPSSSRTQFSDDSRGEWRLWWQKSFLAGQVLLFENFVACSQCRADTSSGGRTPISGGKPVQWSQRCPNRFGSGDFDLWMPTM